ncbi:MAG: hypothetical protein GYA39_05575, partial [Methanothrix sp.]|nr:hypothetical protein [Methanothrix sp.]
MNGSLKMLALGLFLVIALSMVSASSTVQESSPKKVLILASYNPGMKWEDEVISEIKLHFAMKMPSARIYVEYMDTKRMGADEARLADLKNLYIKKYKNSTFDLVISSDADAFNFLLENRDEIFPETPVVFCGIVYFDPGMLKGTRDFTGVVEAYDVAGTISLMLSLHPDTRHIAIINDQTATGQAARRVLDDALPSFENAVSFEHLDNLTADELRERLAALSNDSLILLMTLNRDSAGRFLSYEDAAQLILESSPVPFYSIYDFYLGYGVVGGKMISARSQGREAADQAISILEGKAPEDIPVIDESPNRYMFDYFRIIQLGIPLERLPPGSTIINQPFQARALLAGEDLSGLNLSRKNLSQSELQGSDLSMAFLEHSILTRAEMMNSNLTGAYLKGANLDQARMGESVITGANFDDASLEGTNLGRSDLRRASFKNANLNRACLRNSLLIGANLTNASPVGGNIIGANFSHANLSNANLSEARVSGANFFCADLRHSKLVFTNLIGANLSRADISHSKV